jgi:hypothetical protein
MYSKIAVQRWLAGREQRMVREKRSRAAAKAAQEDSIPT